jgi:hypothetical protein
MRRKRAAGDTRVLYTYKRPYGKSTMTLVQSLNHEVLQKNIKMSWHEECMFERALYVVLLPDDPITRVRK